METVRHALPGRPVQLPLVPAPALTGREVVVPGAAAPSASVPTLPTSVAALARFAQTVRLISVDPACNRARCYVLLWQPGVWGGGALIRTWGRLGTPGRMLVAHYPDRLTAQPVIRALLARRLRHGYQAVDWR